MQSAAFDQKKTLADRANQLYWRRQRSRLEAEAIRDALLACSDTLEQRMFGPGTLDENNQRRSAYFTIKHSDLIPVMQVFDAPDAIQGVGERPTTTIAPQALYLMNSRQVRTYAEEMARRLQRHGEGEKGRQGEARHTSPTHERGHVSPDSAVLLSETVSAGYMRALGRPPSEDELADSLLFLRKQTESYQAEGRENATQLALADFCQALMCLNEFVYVE